MKPILHLSNQNVGKVEMANVKMEGSRRVNVPFIVLVHIPAIKARKTFSSIVIY